MKVPPTHVLVALHDLGEWQDAGSVARYVARCFGDGLGPAVDGRDVVRALMALLDEGEVERIERDPERRGGPPSLWRITEKGRTAMDEWMETVS